jgi:hypothetical protein
LSTRRSRKSDSRPPELLHEVVCRPCGQPVLRLVELKAPPGLRLVQLETIRVILTRTQRPNVEPWPEEPPADWVKWYSRRKRSLRLDEEWKVLPLADDEPQPDHPPFMVLSACNCTSSIRFMVHEVLALEGETTEIHRPRRAQS